MSKWMAELRVSDLTSSVDHSSVASVLLDGKNPSPRKIRSLNLSPHVSILFLRISRVSRGVWYLRILIHLRLVLNIDLLQLFRGPFQLEQFRLKTREQRFLLVDLLGQVKVPVVQLFDRFGMLG